MENSAYDEFKSVSKKSIYKNGGNNPFLQENSDDIGHMSKIFENKLIVIFLIKFATWKFRRSVVEKRSQRLENVLKHIARAFALYFSQKKRGNGSDHILDFPR